MQRQRIVDFNQEDEYASSNERRGLALIINNENFGDWTLNRVGSSRDADALEGCFRGLGFDVSCFNNLTSEEMVKELHNAAKTYDHSKADCFVCAIMSHGEEMYLSGNNQQNGGKPEGIDDLYGVDMVALTTDVVLRTFDNCPGLIGKPKLFFFEMPRGVKLDDGVKFGTGRRRTSENDTQRTSENDAQGTSENDAQRTSENDAQRTSENDAQATTASNEQTGSNICGLFNQSRKKYYAHSLVMYATPPGYHSWRRVDGASWFIESLVKVLSSDGVHISNLTSLLTIVCRKVALNTSSSEDPQFQGKKGMPVVENRLLKDVIFRSKAPDSA